MPSATQNTKLCGGCICRYNIFLELNCGANLNNGRDAVMQRGGGHLSQTITACKLSLGQGFYTCLSFCSSGEGGWLPSMHHRSPAVCLQGVSASRGLWFEGILHPGGWAHLRTRTRKAGGTQPIGMISCLRMYLTLLVFR